MLARQEADDGVLHLVAVNDRSMHIEVGWGLEGSFTDAHSRRILDQIVKPRFQQGFRRRRCQRRLANPPPRLDIDSMEARGSGQPKDERSLMTTLYDATVARFLQTLEATEGVLQKGADWCAETGTDPGELVSSKLRDDMLPLLFQVVSVHHHSLNAIRGVEAGSFSPPPSLDLDYPGLQELIVRTRSELETFEPEAIEALADRDLTFSGSSFSVDFVGRDFLLSFSVPNFFFHSTTTYALLRMHGVPLGKRDFLGALSIKR